MIAYLRNYIPHSYLTLKEGYSLKYFIDDLFSGVSIGIISLPLALAFAIGSGVDPEQGLYTAIVAGFLISLLGGSRVQIGGPTGAYVIIVYGVVQKYGYEGLQLATFIAACLLILMALFRFGVLLKFIPFPVTTGFTTGIAVAIFFSQIKDFLGLNVENIPPHFIEKCKILCSHLHTWNIAAFLVAFTSLASIFLIRRYFPRLPAVILAMIGASLAVMLLDLPVETIDSRFGELANRLPSPSLPVFSYESIKMVFPDAITIALLGAIESLLSAVVADGLTGHRHRSNCELLGQGIANVGSVIFSGIPATGAIARTAANIQLGAKSPLSGMIHAITLFLIMLYFAPYVGKIPLAALSSVLIFVAWNMSELGHFYDILKGNKGDALIMVSTFLLTVLIDVAVAVEIGVLLAAFLFLKQMTDRTTVQAAQFVVRQNENEEPEKDDDVSSKVPSDTVVFEIAGPFFYSVSDLLDEVLSKYNPNPRVFILRLHKTPMIDTTGLKALRQFALKCEKKGIKFIISDVSQEQSALLTYNGFQGDMLYKSIGQALKQTAV